MLQFSGTKTSLAPMILAVFVVIMLIPFSSAFALVIPKTSPQVSTSPQVTYPATLSSKEMGAFVKIPFSLPSILARSLSQGKLDPSSQISFSLVLPQKNPLGLEQFLSAVYDPSSPEYKHFLTVQQFTELYGPDTSEGSLLVSYLNSNGIKAEIDSANPYLILASGTSGQIDSALKTNMQSFSYEGKSFFSPSSEPELPGIFSNVLSIMGLDNYAQKATGTSPETPVETPFYHLEGLATANTNGLYYSPSEIEQMYNVSALSKAGYTGAGETIAIIDAYGDPYIQQEVDNFSATYGIPSTTLNVICVDSPCDYNQGIIQGWNTEIALDVEWSHALAPGAMIDLYIGSNSSQPLFDAVNQAVNDPQTSVISMSWGSPENTMGQSSPLNPTVGQSYPWTNQLFQQAAAEGITAFASAGDGGAFDQGTGQSSPYGGPIYPSTDPYVTGVGGTSLYMNTTAGYLQYPASNATGSYGAETAWSWAYGGATGGGYSTIFARPSWQTGPGLSTSTGGRGDPDVGWVADPATGVIIGIYEQGYGVLYTVIGGTSVGAPSWSGVTADMDQKAGSNLGLLNPTIYSILNDNSQYAKAFHDVTMGNNNPNDANVGWDQLTGVGSPNIGVLSSLLAQKTGQISVAVTNSLTGQLTQSFAYGSTIGLSAKVGSSSSQLVVRANITSASGSLIATNIPMTLNSGTNLYSGSYTVRTSDPPGEWSAIVRASTGSSFGVGYTTFSVGGGITLLEPFYDSNNQTFNSHNFQIGSPILVTAQVTSPSGSCCVVSGSYNATFYLNTLGGKVEGTLPLSYDASSQLWQGNFTVPQKVDQGNWILAVSGTDSSGNKAAATYQWMYVGLNIIVQTDSTNYVLGDQISIFATANVGSGANITAGSLIASVTDKSKVVASVPLEYDPLLFSWYAVLQTKDGNPTGYYDINVTGSDTQGNSGLSNTIVEVAPFHLQVKAVLSSQQVSVVGGTISSVTAKVSYPNGTALKTGSVVADEYIDLGGVATLQFAQLTMNYVAQTGEFVGLAPFYSSGILNQAIGKYDVIIQAYDSSGDYGNYTTYFNVLGLNHAPIAITSNSGFKAANGVTNGSGSIYDPYVIAGINTSSISISGSGITSAFVIVNNWVSGGSGDGYTINAPSSSGVFLELDTASQNAGNGFVISNTVGANASLVVATGNSKAGFLVSGSSTDFVQGEVGESVAAGNKGGGIIIENSQGEILNTDFVSGNNNVGIELSNSADTTLELSYVFQNPTGIEITGTAAYDAELLAGNVFSQNNVGVSINGMNQPITRTQNFSSYVDVYFNAFANNSVGLLSTNHGVVDAENNSLGYNNNAFEIQNSFPLVIGNVIAQNSGTAINITGYASQFQQCIVTFNDTGATMTYSSCVAENLIDSNGNSSSMSGNAIALSNLNGTFVYLNGLTNNLGQGLELQSVTGSSIFSNLVLNNSLSGIYLSKSGGNNVSFNGVGNESSGLEVSLGQGNAIQQNNVTLNSRDGIALVNTHSNIVLNNSVSDNGQGCTSSHDCISAAGIHVSNSSQNEITLNTVYNDTSPSPNLGFGILLDSSSASNTLKSNNVTKDNVGIGLENTLQNTVSGNTIADNTYGIYLIKSSQNSISGNNFASNLEDVYPNPPAVHFVSPSNGVTLNGAVLITWNYTGPEITNESVSLNGQAIASTGTTYLWNTTSLPDSTYTFLITVENSAGFSSNASLKLTTNNIAINNHAVYVTLLAPGGFPITNSGIVLANSTFSKTSPTNESGTASFHKLRVGTYNVSAVVNGTSYSNNVVLSGNSSVVIAPPTLVTTAIATNSTGSSVPIQISGNVSSPQIQNLTINKDKNGTYVVSFTINGTSGTIGTFSLNIPKSSIPNNYKPNIYIDGSLVANSSSLVTQNSLNYSVALTVHFSSDSILLVFNPPSSTSFFGGMLTSIIAIIVVIVVVLVAVIALRSRRQKREQIAVQTTAPAILPPSEVDQPEPSSPTEELFVVESPPAAEPQPQSSVKTQGVCPNCGKELNADDKFCHNCGAKVEGAPSP